MNSFSNLQDNIFNDESFFGGAFDEKSLDTTIGLKPDMGVGNINSLFNSLQNADSDTSDTTKIKRDTPNSGSSTGGNSNTGNSTIWIIVLIVILILIIVAFIIYKISKTRQVRDKVKQMYTNVTDKISSLRDSVKNTAIS